MKSLPILLLLAIFTACTPDTPEILTYTDSHGNEIPIIDGDTLCSVLPDTIHPLGASQIVLSFDKSGDFTVYEGFPVETAYSESDTAIFFSISAVFDTFTLNVSYLNDLKRMETPRESFAMELSTDSGRHMMRYGLMHLNSGAWSLEFGASEPWSEKIRQYNAFGECQHSFWRYVTFQFGYQGELFNPDDFGDRIWVNVHGFLWVNT